MSNNRSVRERMNIPKRDEQGRIHYYKDITGQKFERLTAVKYMYTKNKKAYWLCKCDCGNEVIIAYTGIKSGNTKSCGCLHTEISRERVKILIENQTKYKRKHEKKIALVFKQMKRRCYNEKCKTYKNYGGRGITICKEWLEDFNSFYEWSIKNGFKEELSIDRINVNGNYEPKNCRWVTNLEQQNNKRNNKFIEFNGEKHTCAEWSRITQIPAGTIADRVRKKWNPERILNNNYKRKN